MCLCQEKGGEESNARTHVDGVDRRGASRRRAEAAQLGAPHYPSSRGTGCKNQFSKRQAGGVFPTARLTVVPSLPRQFTTMFAAVRSATARRGVMRALSTAKNPSVRDGALR